MKPAAKGIERDDEARWSGPHHMNLPGPGGRADHRRRMVCGAPRGSLSCSPAQIIHGVQWEWCRICLNYWKNRIARAMGWW